MVVLDSKVSRRYPTIQKCGVGDSKRASVFYSLPRHSRILELSAGKLAPKSHG